MSRIQKLNEEIEKLLEWEESPEFKDFMQQRRDKNTAKRQSRMERDRKEAEYYADRAKDDKSSDNWYNKEADEYNAKADKMANSLKSKRRAIDNIYKLLGDTAFDIQNCKITTIPTEGLTSSGFRKEFKRNYNADNNYALIVPEARKTWNDRDIALDEESISIFLIGYDADNKFYSWRIRSINNLRDYLANYQELNMDGSDTLNPIMAQLNKGEFLYPYLFLVEAPSTVDLRNERQDSRRGMARRIGGYNSDKSGYEKRDLQREFGKLRRAALDKDFNEVKEQVVKLKKDFLTALKNPEKEDFDLNSMKDIIRQLQQIEAASPSWSNDMQDQKEKIAQLQSLVDGVGQLINNL